MSNTAILAVIDRSLFAKEFEMETISMVLDFLAFCGWIIIGFAGFLVVIAPLVLREHTQDEGTATAWEMFGKYACTTMQYRGRHFDADGFIVQDKDPFTHMVTVGPNITGSCWLMFRIPFTAYIFYVAGLVKPVKYLEFNNDDGFGNENFVFLHELPRNIKLSKAETKSENGVKAIPLDVEVVYRLRPEHVEQFLYTGPKDVAARTDEVMGSLIKDVVNASTPAEVQAMKANSAGFSQAICNLGQPQNTAGGDLKDIGSLRADWGVGVICNRILIKDIGFQKEDQDAQAEVQRQSWQAKGAAAELIGSMLEIEAVALGFPDAAAVRTHLAATNPARLSEIVQLANDTLIQRKLGTGYRRFDVPGIQELATVLLKKLSP